MPEPGGDVVGRTYLSQDVSIDGAARPIPGTGLQLDFDGDQVSARAGCNTKSGEGEIRNGVLRVESLAMTQMACESAVMEQEQWWAQFLTSGPQAAVRDRSLTLMSGSTVVEMTAQDAPPDLPLSGAQWWLQSIEQEAVSTPPAGVASTMTMTDGVMTIVVADCRSTSVPVAQSGTTLTFDPQACNVSACVGDAAAVDGAVAEVYGDGQVVVLVDRDVLTVGGPRRTSLDYVG